jgi:hypothetical protein
MWPNRALADLIRNEVMDTIIEDIMCEYNEYLQMNGCKLSKWSLNAIANHFENSDPDVKIILQKMRNTDWADKFEEMHGYISHEYGPELADMFNLYFFCEGLSWGQAV